MSYKPHKKEYTPPSSPYHHSQWIESLKKLYKIAFFAIIILGFIACLKLCSDGYVGLGLMILAVSLLIALLAVGFEIIFIELASDVRDMVSYVYLIGTMKVEDKNRDTASDIESAAENIYQIAQMLEKDTAKKE